MAHSAEHIVSLWHSQEDLPAPLEIRASCLVREKNARRSVAKCAGSGEVHIAWQSVLSHRLINTLGSVSGRRDRATAPGKDKRMLCNILPRDYLPRKNNPSIIINSPASSS